MRQLLPQPRSFWLLVLAWLLVAASPLTGASESPPTVTFTEVTSAAGLQYVHGYLDSLSLVYQLVAGGVAAGDFDSDGWVDLYAVGGDVGSNHLFRNRRDGSFEDVAEAAGLDRPASFLALSSGAPPLPTPTVAPLPLHRGSGPTFADYDGDGHLDLFLGAIERRGPRLFRNRGDGRFEDRTREAGLVFEQGSYVGAAFGDYDRDGDLDLMVAQWGNLVTDLNMPDHKRRLDHLWRNNGDGTFTGNSAEVGLVIREAYDSGLVWYWTFTPNFVDINNDGWPDVLFAADFKNSQVFLNSGSGTFSEITSPVISDENGMGAAIGDYDNDGDLDWFVSSIYDPENPQTGNCEPMTGRCDWNGSGNRMYRNDGSGTFEDVTDQAGVRDGAWGWGSCFADFDNDGFLDLFHVNGWGFEAARSRFFEKPARLFLANGDGSFRERAVEAGIDDRGEGRGVVCFDYDRDGDIDVFIANNGRRFGDAAALPSRLYRNNSGNARHYLQVKLRGKSPNTEAIGARVYVTAGGFTQMRELRAGSNYVSQDPAVAHFGLGDATTIDELRIVWPDQTMQKQVALAADAFLVVEQEGRAMPTPTATVTEVAVFSPTGTAEPTETQTQEPTPSATMTPTLRAVSSAPGDANCDGRLTAADFTELALLVGRERPLPSCTGADVNLDGHIDASDLVTMPGLVFTGP